MHKHLLAAVAGVALAALVAPVAPAVAAPTTSTDALSSVVDARKPAKVKMKTSPRSYSHYGQAGVKVTADFGKGAKGKVVFTANGKKVAKVKAKKGKASYRFAASTAPGSYKVKAKLGKRSGTTKVTVYNSSLKLSAVEFSVSKQAVLNYTPGYEVPYLTGTVVFKGKNPSEGYVDIYENGNTKGGSSSPDYCCMASVQAGGTFSFSPYSFLRDVAEEKPVGTYRYKAFYTPTASFDEYIYSSWITVHVTA